MNDVLASVVESLGRTTLCLAAVGAVVAVTLRLARTSWPAAHRLGWVITLLVGWTFLRLPVAVPWYETPATGPETLQVATPEVASVESPLLAPHFNPFAEPAAEPFAAPVTELPASASDEVIEIGPSAQALEPPQLAPQPSGGVEVSVASLPQATEPEVITLSEPPTIAPPIAPPANDWPRIILAAWLTGIVVIVAASAIGYVGFVRRLTPRSCRETWQQEWTDLVAAAGVRRAIPLRVTAGQGPMLCRLPRGMELVVPERLWRDLSPAARRAILRHELAHYLRGDVWKSLAARVLALPHWFNPVAWLAVRRFEEAAEWACDAAAADDSATDYARVLLQLGEAAPQPAYASSAGGRTLAARIRRVLAGPARPDSRLKKTAIVTVALFLVGASLVQLDLVAKQPSEQPSGQIAAADPPDPPAEEDPFAAPPRAEDADPDAAPPLEPPSDLDSPEAAPPQDDPRQPADPADLSGPGPLADEASPLGSLANEGTPGPLPGEGAPLADLPEGAAAPPKSAPDAADTPEKRMVAEANRAYEASVAAFEAETSTMEPVYEWSQRWMKAAESAAKDQAGRIAAAQGHLDRMKELNRRIARLFQTGTRGGEAQPYYSSQFYVAEAERHLGEVKAASDNTQAKPNLTSRAKATQSLADAKQAYLDAQGKFESGKLGIDGLFEWSERYRQAAERAAADQAGKVQAAQDHLERMKEAFRRVEAAFEAGSREGTADRVNAAKVFVAEAERRLAEVNGNGLLEALRQGEIEWRRMTPEKAKLIYHLNQDVEHYAAQARAQELLAKRPNAEAFDVGESKRRQQEFEKLRDQSQKRLNAALRDSGSPSLAPSRISDAVVEQELAKDPVVFELNRRLEDAKHAVSAYTASKAEPNSSPTIRDLKKQINQLEQAIDEHKTQQRPRVAEMLAAKSSSEETGSGKPATTRAEVPATDIESRLAVELEVQLREATKEATQLIQRFSDSGNKLTTDERHQLQSDIIKSSARIKTLQHQLELARRPSIEVDPAQQKLRAEIEVVDLEVKIAELTGQLKTEEARLNQLSQANSKAPGTVAQVELNTARIKIETLHRQLTLLNKKLALTKDLADREKKSTESSQPKPATDKATTGAGKTLPVTPPQAAVDRAARGPEKPSAASRASEIEIVDLEVKIAELTGQLHKAKIELDAASRSLADSRGNLTPKQKQGLEVEKLQSIAQVDTLNRQLALLNKKLALTKDLADREKQSTEAPPSKPATDAVKLVPPQAEIDSVPIELPVKPNPNLTPKADPVSKLRYNGKPFHAWAETLRDDLSPESRTEAIEALAMFGRFGLAEAAAQEILAAMRDYSVWSMDGSAEGKLKFAATKAFKELPEKVTRPLLTTALASDSGNQRMFAATILGGQVRDPKEREKLFVPLLDDTDAEVRRLAAINLQGQADKYLAVVEIMREALASPDNHVANWAVQVVGLKNPQPFVPILPTLVERLDTEEQPLLQQFQMALRRFGPLAIPALEAGEQSDNRRVRAMSQQTLQQIRSAAPPVAGEDSKQKPGTEPAPEASYRNKTFKSWLDTLKRDLSPESRTEAIRALAVFAAHGHAHEVAQAILDMMGDYSIFDMSASPDAPLKAAALDAFGKLDRGAAFPLVDAALKSENANRRMFAAVMLDQWVPKENTLELDELLADPDPAARLLIARIIVGRDVSNTKALKIVRAGLESSDEQLRSAAIVTANGLVSLLKPDVGVEGPVLEALRQLGPALKPIMESAARSDAPNQAEVQAALRLLSFTTDEPKK